jgi:hypothetical protein
MVVHYTIATRQGSPVPLCGQPARNIHSTATPWGFTCQICLGRFVKLEKMPRLDQVDYMQRVVDKWMKT